jgi:hypothetical protein
MMERGIVYVCPSCAAMFDAPSVCMDGAVAKPVLMNVTREQLVGLAHQPAYTSSGVTEAAAARCSCGWVGEDIDLPATPEALEALFAAHAGARVA